MLYLITEIIVFLFIAAIFGLLIGWLLRGFSLNKKMSELYFDLQNTRSELAECNQKCQALKGEAEYLKSTVINLSNNKKLVTETVPQPTVMKDNLTRIRGIGKVLENRLNSLGILSFRQLAELNNDEVNDLSHKIGAFPDRIERDAWLEKARTLHQEKYGEKI